MSPTTPDCFDSLVHEGMVRVNGKAPHTRQCISLNHYLSWLYDHHLHLFLFLGNYIDLVGDVSLWGGSI